MVTTQTADKALKSYYLDAVSNELNYHTNPFLARIKQTTADVCGRDVRKTVRIGLNGGVGAGTETGDLPATSGNRYEQFVSLLKNLYGKIEISDKAIRASQNSEGAFVNLLNDEMEGLLRSSTFNLGRMLFGDGSGSVANIVDIDAEVGEFLLDDASALAEGMVVDIMEGDKVLHASHTISSVDRTKKLVIFDGKFAFEMAEGKSYSLAIQGSRGLELTGLKALFGKGALYGIDRTDKAWMTPITVNIAATGLKSDTIQIVMDRLEEASGSKVNFILCSWDVRRALTKVLASEQNRVCDSITLEGGFQALSYNGIPVVVDRFCPKGTMYLLNTDDFALHQLCDWQWLEGEDGKILKQVPGKPVYTATLVKYAELMCYRPCGQACIQGIKEG